MSEPSSERLYNLLPAIYRQRDVAQGEPLRALLAVIEQEFQALEADIEGLYENWFIETCDEWLVPYIGDLLGVQGLTDPDNRGFNLRAYVANAIAYRRRKGTPATLERVARDVTGWPTRVVEYFDRLSATQHLQHLRPGKGGTLDLRDRGTVEQIGTPFETAASASMVDVRRIATRRGRHNIPNLGLFLWRLQSYGVSNSPAWHYSDSPGCFCFSPIPIDQPLFNRPRPRTAPTQAAAEINLPGPISRYALASDLEGYRRRYGHIAAQNRPPGSQYYGPGHSLHIIADGKAVPPISVVSRDLSDWGRAGILPGQVAIDPQLGRLAFAEGEEPDGVEVAYHYGFSADLGGGPYDRQQTLADRRQANWTMRVARQAKSDQPGQVQSLTEALSQWQDHCKNQQNPRGVIQIMDNAISEEVEFELPPGSTLVLEAADGVRPALASLAVYSQGPHASLTLNGLAIEYVEYSGRLKLFIKHCTVISFEKIETEPKTPTQLHLTISRSMVGPLTFPSFTLAELAVQDSIIKPVWPWSWHQQEEKKEAIAIDVGSQVAPRVRLERTSVLGAVKVEELDLASEVIFTGPVCVERPQAGSVRYSYVPPDSRTPQRYRCQPDLALEAAVDRSRGQLSEIEQAAICDRLKPVFTSTRYGHPGCAQLSQDSPPEISAGAEHGLEMGAFHHLLQPQREANLIAILDEYLPLGLEAGIFYIT
jgi:hypothetical protein